VANKEHLKILKQGKYEWDVWRRENPNIQPDLTHANLVHADLRFRDLVSADLSRADLRHANLVGAKLAGSHFVEAILVSADLGAADLDGSYLVGANLRRVNLQSTKLYGANLSRANLGGANFNYTALRGANLYGAIVARTTFANVDLREIEGLERIKHRGPSEVGVSTIYRSEGNIPEVFLRGCGVPADFITQIPSLVAAAQPIQFYSCFISYSSKDGEFARRLHSRMREVELRVWFAPEDMKGGDYFSDQIDRAIQVHDRLLLVLSENSIASNWVIREIKRARKVEEKEGRKKLFPISLTGYEALRGWECLDHDSGLDLAEEVRKFHIPDFSNWKSHDDFERAFARLYDDLKASA
jgi:uncharacterized protein YjbI with pentapeptide repeats